MNDFVGRKFVNVNDFSELYCIVGKHGNDVFVVDVYTTDVDDSENRSCYKGQIFLTKNEVKRGLKNECF